MLDEKSIWRVGDFLTRGAEEHGVLQVDEASLYRHVHIPLAAGWDGPLMTTPREVTEICAKDIGLATFKASVSGSKPGPLATSEQAQAAAEWAYIIFCDLREDPLERDDERYWGLTIKAHSVMRMDRTRLPYLPDQCRLRARPWRRTRMFVLLRPS